MTAMMLLLTLAGIGAVTAESQPMTLPYSDSFSSGQMDSGWTQKVSKDGSVKITDGWLACDLHENGYAHVERPLQVDDTTVSAKIYSCASIFVVWDANNWCALGRVSPTPFPRLYSTLTIDGKTVEADHRGCNGGSPPYVRIQLGRDCIRFEYSNDRETWQNLRTVERPEKFSGAPVIVAFGKHYAPGMQPFGDVKEPTDPGTKYYGSVSEIQVTKTADKDLRMTQAERKKLGKNEIYEIGRNMLKSIDEPTFDSVAHVFPEMKFPREVVGVPEHPLDIGVDYYGRLDVSPWSPTPLAWFEIGEPGVPFGGEKIKLKRRLLDGYLPVITLGKKVDGVEYEMSVFGWSEGSKPEGDLYAYIHIKASGSKTPQKLALVYDGGNKKLSFDMLPGKDGETERYLRMKYPEPAAASQIDADEFQKKQKETISYWQEHIKRAQIFDIPDKHVDQAYKAWIVYSMLNADRMNGYCEIHDGAGFYDIIFGYSMSLYGMAMDMYGMHDYVSRCLDTQLHFQQPNGLYLQECGLPDHGSMLYALARHYKMTNDKEWLKQVAPQMIKGCDWIMDQREQSPKDGVAKGLIKFRPYNDYPEPVFNYLGNTYACLALENCSEALREIGMKAEADRYAYEGKRFREDIMTSTKAAEFEEDGMTLLPIEPDTHRLLKLSKYRGGDYYGLTASCVLEHEFLSPDDRPAQLIVDLLEKRNGLVLGTCEFMEGIDHAYTYGYLMNQLKQDNIKKVLFGFWSWLAYGMTRDTYSPVEVTVIATGENHLTLPHTYSCTQQLRLLRNMLLREDGNHLVIGQAVPRDWLQAGKEFGINSAPTSFGEVSCRITSNADGSMTVRLNPPTRQTPEEIRIRLRHPRKLDIAEVTSVKPVKTAFTGDTVTIKKPSGPVELTVMFKGR